MASNAARERGACLRWYGRALRWFSDDLRPRPGCIPTAIPACTSRRACGRSRAIPRRPHGCSPAATWACSAGTSPRRDGRICLRRCRTCGRSRSIRKPRLSSCRRTRPGSFSAPRMPERLGHHIRARRTSALRRQCRTHARHADRVRSSRRQLGLGHHRGRQASIAARTAA